MAIKISPLVFQTSGRIAATLFSTSIFTTRATSALVYSGTSPLGAHNLGHKEQWEEIKCWGPWASSRNSW
ncbi:hypothetical protein BC936DRAFT_146087 [Jimgerdemannia flammicorona]|uniref:Uncharacterized protein n=1 Tax=Jimgerdemannia flammicorona TaxID=994334 RepID=A0A433D8E5_9FUNG|nr:hypothetical protein BC936DRAFT_146087 [Jimgerdemannia flammicorona]